MPLTEDTPAGRIRAALEGKTRVHRDPKTRPPDGNQGSYVEVRAADVIAAAEPLAGKDPVAAALLMGAKGASDEVRNPAAVKVYQLADDLFYLLELGAGPTPE